jgi:hypothetical protein
MKNLLATLSNPDKIQKGIETAVNNFDAIYGTNLSDASKLFRSAVALGKEDVIAGYGTGRALMGPIVGGLSAGGIGGLAGLLVQSPGIAKASITGMKQIPKIAGFAGRVAPQVTRGVSAALSRRSQ